MDAICSFISHGWHLHSHITWMPFAVPYHMDVICNPISHLQSHITWIPFAVPCHVDAIWSPISHGWHLQSHITWMPFAFPYHMNAICNPISHGCHLQFYITWMLYSVPLHINAVCSPTSHELFRTGCQTLLWIETPHAHVLKLRLITLHLPKFIIYQQMHKWLS